MRFMTAATVQNLPAYLAEARAREIERRQEEERQKQLAYQASMNKVAQAFIKNGDYSAQGLKKFAEDNELSMPEIEGLMKITTTFKQLEKQRAEIPKVWARDKSGMETRMIDQEGITNYPKPDLTWTRDANGVETRVPDTAGLTNYPKQDNVWVTLPDGSRVRRPDAEGLTSAPDQTPRGNVWVTLADGTKVRKPDTEGLTSAPDPGKTDNVPDYMKYASSVLGKSLGYTTQSGWPDEESGLKYNTIMENVAAKMKDKPGSDVNQVLFDTVRTYDTELKAAKLIDKIPANGIVTSVKDAKAVVDEAVSAGGDVEDIKTVLKQKGWKDEQIEKIIKDAETKKEERPTEAPAPDGMSPIDTASQIDQDPSIDMGLKSLKDKKKKRDNPLGL
jgi:hypothetical protein